MNQRNKYSNNFLPGWVICDRQELFTGVLAGRASVFNFKLCYFYSSILVKGGCNER
jgi:hypothetical protein